MNKDLFEKILKAEQNYPNLFSNFEKRDWGCLFFNEENKGSYDSNSAIVTADVLSSEILAEINAFYNDKNLTPRYKHINEQYFANEKKQIPDFRVMVQQGEVYIISNNRLKIKILEEYDENITQNILLGSQKEYFRRVLVDSMKNKNYKLAVGYLMDEPVSMAGMWFSPYGVTRIDSVQTGIFFRGCGFAREVVKFAIEYAKNQSDNEIYLLTDNPTAERIYKQAGFVEINI
ncbi:MAG: GNAT family N-acetyltransferase [Clostridia bacterium]|nr:GNAT family N-acetyltransferase [Clostridia bacterium]